MNFQNFRMPRLYLKKRIFEIADIDFKVSSNCNLRLIKNQYNL